MNILVNEKTKRIKFTNLNRVSAVNEILLSKLYQQDLVNCLKSNVDTSQDVFITFPLVTYWYDSIENELSLWHTRIPKGSTQVSYTEAFKHLKASKATRKKIKQFKFKNRRMLRKNVFTK